MESVTDVRAIAYGPTTISDRATALLGSRYSFGDKFEINHATFVLRDAPDAQSLLFKSVTRSHHGATDVKRVGASTPVEEELQDIVVDLEIKLQKAREALHRSNAEKEKHKTSARDLRAELHRVSMSSFRTAPEDNASDSEYADQAEQTFKVDTDIQQIDAARSAQTQTVNEPSSIEPQLPSYTESKTQPKFARPAPVFVQAMKTATHRRLSAQPSTANKTSKKALLENPASSEAEQSTYRHTDKPLPGKPSGLQDQKQQFPPAFDRWETLSSHWEGLTSYWIRKLEGNSADFASQPIAQQMTRQITDLSAAGANLFHAVVELQRLRASSERKFQRWFFETRAEQEKAQEQIAELQTQLAEHGHCEVCESRQASASSFEGANLPPPSHEIRTRLHFIRRDVQRWSKKFVLRRIEKSASPFKTFLEYASKFLRHRADNTLMPSLLLEASIAHELFSALFKHSTSYTNLEHELEESIVKFIVRTGPPAGILRNLSTEDDITERSKSLHTIVASALLVAARLRDENRSLVVLDMEAVDQGDMHFDVTSPLTLPHPDNGIDLDDEQFNGRPVTAVIGPGLLTFRKVPKQVLDVDASDVLIPALVLVDKNQAK